MALNAFFTYLGGKTHASRYYPPPAHPTIVEPFAGAAGYSVRYHRRRVILVEKNPEIAGIWRYLIGVSARELLGIPDVPPEGVSSMRLCPEARSLVGFNCGSVSGDRGAERITSWGKKEPTCSWGPILRARLASQVERIRHWRIIEGDYSLAPDVEATWFVDPPYQVEGESYACPSSAIDFRALGKWCRARRGQIMVCENEGATWLPFEPFRFLPTTAWKRQNGGSVEVLWHKQHNARRAHASSTRSRN